MRTFIEKFRGDQVALPPRASGKAMLLAGLGAFITVAAIAGPTGYVNLPMVLGSFGASCVLVFGFPDVPFSQPRNVVLGHLISSASGLAFLSLLGPHWWSAALALALAIVMMMATRTVHPPAGSNPIIIYLLHPGWIFLIAPTLVGAVLLVLVAIIYNNATRDGRYPKYW